jgi:hypothetical protein
LISSLDELFVFSTSECSDSRFSASGCTYSERFSSGNSPSGCSSGNSVSGCSSGNSVSGFTIPFYNYSSEFSSAYASASSLAINPFSNS